jgi:2-hydroxychromene-2-carboxylate isomerase
MARRLDFYFDCSSPWTYLAFHAVQPLAAELGAEIAWKPILVGGVFNTVNQTVYDSRAKPNPRKQSYMLKTSPTGRASTTSGSSSRPRSFR